MNYALEDASPANTVSPQAIVSVLSCVLTKLVEKNDENFMHCASSRFHSLVPSTVPIYDYLMRISKYSVCSGECFLMALVYIDRIVQYNETFIVNSRSIHRLLITSVMVASKFFDDQFYNNAYFAKIGGVLRQEINILEIDFLCLLRFEAGTHIEEAYIQYYEEICRHSLLCPCRQGFPMFALCMDQQCLHIGYDQSRSMPDLSSLSNKSGQSPLVEQHSPSSETHSSFNNEAPISAPAGQNGNSYSPIVVAPIANMARFFTSTNQSTSNVEPFVEVCVAESTNLCISSAVLLSKDVLPLKSSRGSFLSSESVSSLATGELQQSPDVLNILDSCAQSMPSFVFVNSNEVIPTTEMSIKDYFASLVPYSNIITSTQHSLGVTFEGSEHVDDLMSHSTAFSSTSSPLTCLWRSVSGSVELHEQQIIQMQTQ